VIRKAAWKPKDHQMRMIVLADQKTDLLAAWQAIAAKGCHYVLMEVRC